MADTSIVVGLGPTQGAERHETDVRRWQQRPRAAAALRIAIFALPLLLSLAFTLAVGRWYPPDVVGVNRWVWIGVVFVVANLFLLVLVRLAKAFTPLASLMALSLVFPDQAPSRAKSALRSSSSAKMLRSVHSWRILENDGAGNFTFGGLGPSTAGAAGIAVGNFDGVGGEDVATISLGGDNFIYLFN